MALSPQDEAIRHVTAAVSLAAAIDTSANAVGVAESELFYMTPEEVEIAMDTMESMGVTQVRMFVPWYFVEPAPGAYNWANVDKVVNAAEERGIAVLAAVTSTPTWATDSWSPYGAPRNPDDFGNFMGALAERYGAGEGDPESARISAYEIWNEPHAAVFWEPSPDAAAYTEVLKAGYDAVKAVDPSGTVVGGVVYAGQSWGDGFNIGAVEFIEGMYEAGAAGYFDALSYHPYNNDWRFSDGAGSPISAIGILEDIQALMEENGDGDKTVWTSEYGLPTATVSEAQQAEFITDFMDTWAETDGAGPMFLYSLVDLQTGSTNPEDTYGLFRDDWTPKEAALAVQAWIEENGPLPSGQDPSVEDPTIEDPPLPTEPEPEVPTPTTPVDPVAQAIANWQQALADAAAGWAAAWGQALNPTAPATTVSALSATQPETTSETVDLDEAVAEATAVARAAAVEQTATEPETVSDAGTSRAALTEAVRAVAENTAPVSETDGVGTVSPQAPRTESVANEAEAAAPAEAAPAERDSATADSTTKPRPDRKTEKAGTSEKKADTSEKAAKPAKSEKAGSGDSKRSRGSDSDSSGSKSSSSDD